MALFLGPPISFPGKARLDCGPAGTCASPQTPAARLRAATEHQHEIRRRGPCLGPCRAHCQPPAGQGGSASTSGHSPVYRRVSSSSGFSENKTFLYLCGSCEYLPSHQLGLEALRAPAPWDCPPMPVTASRPTGTLGSALSPGWDGATPRSSLCLPRVPRPDRGTRGVDRSPVHWVKLEPKACLQRGLAAPTFPVPGSPPAPQSGCVGQVGGCAGSPPARGG